MSDAILATTAITDDEVNALRGLLRGYGQWGTLSGLEDSELLMLILREVLKLRAVLAAYDTEQSDG